MRIVKTIGMIAIKSEAKKIIVLCPHCGHLYSWYVEPWSDDDDACSLEVCDYCTKLYYIGPANKVGCLACDGHHCSGYEKAYMESGIVFITAEEKERGQIIREEES
jgi:hypothetical protein